ncbi:uncharacterized protein LOC143034091 [Oratosquilla oratoria]|uniref:uncharacterized protein LOC143034091 n=1 Tax=Oratosquilla oratoria TaxID=337810 RepID=UPI003F75D7B6
MSSEDSEPKPHSSSSTTSTHSRPQPSCPRSPLSAQVCSQSAARRRWEDAETLPAEGILAAVSSGAERRGRGDGRGDWRGGGVSIGGSGGRPLNGTATKGAVVGGEGWVEVGFRRFSVKSARKLGRCGLVVAAILYVCQLVNALCFCRSIVVLAGLWVASSYLLQALLSLRAASRTRHALLVGHAFVSGLVGVQGLICTAFLLSGRLPLACISSFHRLDSSSIVRLYVVDVVGLLSAIPALVGAISCLISLVLAVRAACPSQSKPSSPVVLYLPSCSQCPHKEHEHTRAPVHSPSSRIMTSPTSDQSYGTTQNTSVPRSPSPPPSYSQVTEESYA